MRAERVGGWPRRRRGWLSSSWFPALLFLCTLWTLAIAQSIYSMLAANPNFLGVRLSSNGQLLGLVAVFNLLPPLLLFLVWLVLHFLREGWGRGFLGLVAAVLSSLAADNQTQAKGAFYLQDVYRSTQDIPRGTIRRLRVNQLIPQPTQRSIPARPWSGQRPSP